MSLRWILYTILSIFYIAIVIVLRFQITQLEDNSRIVNYAGIVRGRTQKIIKNELLGIESDDLIFSNDSILNELVYGGQEHDLMRNNNSKFQQSLESQIEEWEILKQAISDYRNGLIDNAQLGELSESFWNYSNNTVSAAEETANKLSLRIIYTEILQFVVLGLILTMIIYDLLVSNKRKKKAESENARLLKMYRLLEESTNSYSCLYYKDSNFLWCSYNIGTILGVPQPDITSLESYINIFERNAQDIIMNKIQNSIYGEYKATAVHPVGSKVHLLTQYYSLDSESGEKLVLISGKDISQEVNDQILRDELKVKSESDALTNSLNREYFKNNINQIISHNTSLNLNTAFIILDLDLFKEINDTYGHNIGDQVLIEFVSIINANIRPTDYLIRWGGDEFLLITAINGNKLSKLVGKYKELVEHSTFPHQHQVTCSIGATIHQDNESYEKTFERADKALYISKENGRNKASVL